MLTTQHDSDSTTWPSPATASYHPNAYANQSIYERSAHAGREGLEPATLQSLLRLLARSPHTHPSLRPAATEPFTGQANALPGTQGQEKGGLVSSLPVAQVSFL